MAYEKNSAALFKYPVRGPAHRRRVIEVLEGLKACYEACALVFEVSGVKEALPDERPHALPGRGNWRPRRLYA